MSEEYLLPISLIILAVAMLASAGIYVYGTRQRGVALPSSLPPAPAVKPTTATIQTNIEAERQKDAADLERAAATLRERERKYRSIFENAMIGIAQILPGGRWVAANPALARMLGYFDASEILSAQPDLRGEFFVNADDRIEWYAMLESEKPSKFEADIRRLDQKQVRLALTGTAVRDELGTSRDPR